MSNDERIHNQITGGIFFSTVIQGQNIRVQLPPQVNPALAGVPSGISNFVGREEDLQRLLALLDPASPHAGAIQVSAVAGLAGIGKTELALQAARECRRRGWFTGGILFVNLFGYDPARCVAPGRALDGMLRALGVPPEHIPPDVQDRARLYRSVLAAYAEQGRPILVVIDNASSSDQARPLLPPADGGRAVITSRHTLADIDARLLDLDILTTQAAVDLLAGQLHLTLRPSDARVAEEPEAARTIARLCGNLPLALHIVAALLAARPKRSLANMAADLDDACNRLDDLFQGQWS
jgi:hypothetical protein